MNDSWRREVTGPNGPPGAAEQQIGGFDRSVKIVDVVPHVLFAGRTNLIFVEVVTDAGITGIGHDQP